jgi:diguanylate cyclase (GGDEF)-like protein
MPLLNDLPPQPSQLDIKKRPIMVPAVAFVVLVCTSLIAEVGWSRWNARALQLSEKRIATSNMTRALAQHAETTVKAADTVLVGMVERMQADGRGAAYLERLQQLMMLRVAELPLLHGLFVVDEDGRQLANSQRSPVDPADRAAREYLLYHRDHPDRGPHIAPYLRSPSTGDWIMTVSRRIEHPDGSFAGVAVVTIEREHFKRFYDSFDIGRQGTIFLALDDGTLLARRASQSTNRINIADGPVFREYREKGPVGTAMLTARADNVERLYSYRQLETYPLIVATALSKDEILDNWWQDTWRNFAGILLLAAVFGLLGYRLVNQISIREQLESELREAKHALEALNGSLKTLALHDGLTGLANRRHFETALETEFSRAMRNGTSLALVMLDVDYFKQYNDLYGHPAGDECLKKISQAVRTVQHRAGDLTARYGGEELAVLLPRTDLAGAMAVAEKIRCAISALEIAHAASSAGIVTISAGVGAYIPLRDGKTALALVRAADQALYAAKTNGRDQVRCDTSLLPACGEL